MCPSCGTPVFGLWLNPSVGRALATGFSAAPWLQWEESLLCGLQSENAVPLDKGALQTHFMESVSLEMSTVTGQTAVLSRPVGWVVYFDLDKSMIKH